MVVAVGCRVAAKPVAGAVLDNRVWQHVFDTGPRHHSGGERVVLDDDGRLRKDRLDPHGAEAAPVERFTEFCEPAIWAHVEAMAEIVLATGVETKILPHSRATRL